MITRYKIKLAGVEILDLGAREAFTLDGTDYPRDWIFRNGTIPDHTIESYDATPPPPPPPEPAATGVRMIYEADARGQLSTLLTALTEPERAKLYARRNIVAGDDVAEALRARLGVSEAAMASFIAAAAVRSEV